MLVTYGDVPLLTGDALAALAAEHQRAGNAVTVLTALGLRPDRIRPDRPGLRRASLAAIVEHRDATTDQRAIHEINSGVYAFDGAVLSDALSRLTSANDQGERYLTDVVGIARRDGRSSRHR